MSTYSSNYKLELMETGANANTWGTRTNNNLSVLDAFGAGFLSKSVAGSADVTLTTGNSAPSAEASNKVIDLNGALTGSIKVLLPAVEGEYLFFNNTSGSHTVTIAATGHTSNGVAITQGAFARVYNTGSPNYTFKVSTSILGATEFKAASSITGANDFTAGQGDIVLRSNGAVSATTFLGSGASLTGVDPFPSGTKQVFYQASAPTGWTQDTTAALGNAAMRVVVGTGGGTGGTDTFQTTFGSSRNVDTTSATVSVSGAVGDHTLSTPELASHSHPGPNTETPGGSGNGLSQGAQSPGPNPTGAAGGGGAHSHPFTVSSSSLGGTISMPGMDLKHANVIIAAKD